jgi:tetratricopeptide (TPR) repeat protein
VPNPGQDDWDLDGIGWRCDDEGDRPYKNFNGYIREFPDHSERSHPRSNQNLVIKINDLDFQEIITDEFGQFDFKYIIQPPRLALFEGECDDDSDCRGVYICGDINRWRDVCVPDVTLDRDVDGLPDAVDNCPDVSNPGLEDSDFDGIGDACDEEVEMKELRIELFSSNFSSEPIARLVLNVENNQEAVRLENIILNPNGNFTGRAYAEDETDNEYSEVKVTILTQDITRVYWDDGQWIVGDVGLSDVGDRNFEVSTDFSGRYTSPYLNEGVYRVSFSKEGYQPFLKEIEVTGSRELTLQEPVILQKISCQNIDCFNQELLDYFGIGDYYNALLTAMKSVEFADNNFKGLDAQMALAYNNLGFVHFKMDNPKEAERAYIQALQIWEETLGSDHPNVGASLNNLAALYEKAGGYKQAEEYRKRSKEIWQKAQEEASADICDSMTELLFDCPTDNNNGDEPIFDDIDNDRDGCINEDEFKTIQDIMTRLEVDPSDMTTNEELLLFNDIDENDDGCISKEEFHKAIDEN